MCAINSTKIRVASKCSQYPTVQISCHLNTYGILYKNDKLARFILVKIVNPKEKVSNNRFYIFVSFILVP